MPITIINGGQILCVEDTIINMTNAEKIVSMIKANPEATGIGFQYINIKIDGVSIIADALKTNTTLTALKFEESYDDYYFMDSRYSDAKLQFLADILRTNTSLKSFTLIECYAKHNFAWVLAESLNINTTLTSLNIRDNKIGNMGAYYLSTALKNNQTLKDLNIGHNEIGNHGAVALAEALKINKTLTMLNINFNQIDDEGVIVLSKSLEVNQTLTVLYINNNRFSLDNNCARSTIGCGDALVNMLKNNKTLIELHIDYVYYHYVNIIDDISKQNFIIKVVTAILRSKMTKIGAEDFSTSPCARRLRAANKTMIPTTHYTQRTIYFDMSDSIWKNVLPEIVYEIALLSHNNVDIYKNLLCQCVDKLDWFYDYRKFCR